MKIMRAKDGFTLLEMLVAMTLMVLLSVALFGGLHLGTQIWRRSATLTVDTNAVRKAQMLLASEIARAYPEFGSGQSAIAFDGEAHTMSFLTTFASGDGAMRLVQISADENDGNLALVQTSTPELAPHGAGQRDILLPGIGALAFSYYGGADSNAEPAWHDRWTNRMVLPSLIRVSVETKRGVKWPVLTVTPEIEAGVNCRFDPLTDFCQGLE